MKVTKYPQSCLIVEEGSKRLLIDPGSFVSQKYKVTDLLPVDGILITHEHQDHVDPGLIQSIVGQTSILVVGNESTKKLFGDLINKTVKDQETFNIAGFDITARELPHSAMVDGSPGPQNTGFVINGSFFHPGDGIVIANLSVEKAAVPIAGPDISPRDIYSFIKEIGCHTVVPIHYDYFPNDPKFVSNMLGSIDNAIRVVVLENGQSSDI